MRAVMALTWTKFSNARTDGALGEKAIVPAFFVKRKAYFQFNLIKHSYYPYVLPNARGISYHFNFIFLIIVPFIVRILYKLGSDKVGNISDFSPHL